MSSAGRRRPVQADWWTDEAQLTLARSLIGEADGHKADYAPIAWVYAKRYRLYTKAQQGDLTFAQFITQYSSPLTQKTPRARMVQSLPWGDAEKGIYTRPRLRNRWEMVREFVIDWGEGRHRDPCPSALHFGGAMDKPHAQWEPVRCGKTNNIFWTIKGRRKQS